MFTYLSNQNKLLTSRMNTFFFKKKVAQHMLNLTFTGKFTTLLYYIFCTLSFGTWYANLSKIVSETELVV
jgi:hypothetical protein